MSEYWEDDLNGSEQADNTTPIEYIEGRLVLSIAPGSFDAEDLPTIDPKCDSCPVQRLLQAGAAKLLMDRDEQRRVLIELTGEQGDKLGEDLAEAEIMTPEEFSAKKTEIIEKKEEALDYLEEEIEAIQQEMSALSWDCLGVRSGEDTSIGRPKARYVFCDSELVNDAGQGKPNSVPAYVWID